MSTEWTNKRGSFVCNELKHVLPAVVTEYDFYMSPATCVNNIGPSTECR